MGVATPVIMGAALAAQAVGGAVSAYGTYKAGEANAAAANYQAQVAQNNAVIARDNARYASETGESEAAVVGASSRSTWRPRLDKASSGRTRREPTGRLPPTTSPAQSVTDTRSS